MLEVRGAGSTVNPRFKQGVHGAPYTSENT